MRAREFQEARELLPDGEPDTAFQHSSGKPKHAPHDPASARQTGETGVTVKSASLIVIDPSGRRSTVAIDRLPFRIGRQADNQLVMRDNRTSRVHATIFTEHGEYWIEDLNSRHGTFVNGEKIGRHRLRESDRIEFGSSDLVPAHLFAAGRPGSRVWIFEQASGS